MPDEVVKYVWDGTFEGRARVIIEKRGGKWTHIWHGYWNGGNTIKLYPVRPWAGVWDKNRRQPMNLSIFDVKREE